MKPFLNKLNRISKLAETLQKLDQLNHLNLVNGFDKLMKIKTAEEVTEFNSLIMNGKYKELEEKLTKLGFKIIN